MPVGMKTPLNDHPASNLQIYALAHLEKKTKLCFLAPHSAFPIFGPFDAHQYHSYQNRSISRSAASALKFSCLVHTLTMAGMGTIHKGGPVCATF